MKSIIKFGLLGAFLFLVSNALSILSYANSFLDNWVFHALKFVILGAMMLYAINDFLQYDVRGENYDYSTGVKLCFATGVFSIFVYCLLFLVVQFVFSSPIIALLGFPMMILYNLPFILILSLIVPLNFKGQKGKSQKMDRDDILDADF